MSEAPPPLPPMPVETLSYHVPSGPGRPGILIAVGVISIIIGAITVLTSCGGVFTAIAMSGMPAAMRAARTMQTNTIAYNTPARIGPAARSTITTALQSQHPLSPGQLGMLDTLLQEGGDAMFSFSEANMTPAAISGAISESGQFSDDEGPRTYFILGNGRVEIGEASAVFMPANQQPPIRVAKATSSVHINNTVSSGSTTFPTTFPFSRASMSGWAMTYAVMLVVNLLLSIYLLVIGIMVLARSRRGRGLHLTYAAIKIPLSIAASVAYAMMMSGMVRSIGGASAGVDIYLAVVLAVWLCIGCIYPISVLIVMNTRTVKDYYQSLTVV